MKFLRLNKKIVVGLGGEGKIVRITEKPYTPQGERLCMLWGNPVIFTDCGVNPIALFM